MNAKKSNGKSDGSCGSQSIPPEDIVLKQWYSMTINAPPSALKGQFLLDYNVYQKLLSDQFRCIKYIDYVFTLELSKYGRMHMHGRVKMMKPIAVAHFYQTLYNLNCNYSFDTIKPEDLKGIDDGKDSWSIYMRKGEWYIKPQCEHYKRPYLLTYENTPEPNLKVNAKGKLTDKRFRWEPEDCSSSDSEEL